ncbi:RraA family protein [Desulfofundulus thermocisternus]|uniref:RraA family protein n=1 Tax=Desulfofundulus thermocisternus TaxID=42471 RepID=UPI00217E928A|nr:RraA family protein [Desulfofundulus thermocisternus]MCS5694717.1 RraA family protein [Desulfofundulus thermocisternus]
MITGKIKRPPVHIVEGFRKVSVTTLSDVFDRLGISGIVLGLKQVVPNARITGTAVTVKEVTGTRGTYKPSDFAIGDVFAKICAGDILVIDNAGIPISTWGDLATLYLKQIGGRGVIIDGGCRDVDGIREVGLPVYARHFVPFSGLTRLKILSVNEPVQCGGVRVNPGDVIVGDSTGIAVVPAERSEEILEIALGFEEKEEKIRQEILQGASFMEASAKYGRM